MDSLTIELGVNDNFVLAASANPESVMTVTMCGFTF